MVKNGEKKRRRPSAEKPISLKPLEFDEAVSDLLKVTPEPKVKSEKGQKSDN